MISTHHLCRATIQLVYMRHFTNQQGSDAAFWLTLQEPEILKLAQRKAKLLEHLLRDYPQKQEDFRTKLDAAHHLLAEDISTLRLRDIMADMLEKERSLLAALSRLRILRKSKLESDTHHLDNAANNLINHALAAMHPRKSFLLFCEDYTQYSSQLKPLCAAINKLQTTTERFQELSATMAEGTSPEIAHLITAHDSIMALRNTATHTADAIQQHLPAIDALLSQCIQNFALERLELADLAILRFACHEIKFNPAPTPIAVLAKRCMRVADELSSPQSAQFINGVIHGLAKLSHANE